MGLIYLFTSPSNKMYVGQTVQEFEHRMSQHKRAADGFDSRDSCRALNAAIRKYGWDNMKREILFYCNDDELDMYETRFIEYLDTIAPNGYNLTSGGNANKKFSEESREKMRESQLARDTAPFRRNELTKDLPKFVTINTGYPTIVGHPNCSYKRFANRNLTYDENLEEALRILEQLNIGEIKIEHKARKHSERGLPQGIYIHPNGYYTKVKDEQGINRKKLFTKSEYSREEQYDQAVEYLKSIGKYIDNDNLNLVADDPL